MGTGQMFVSKIVRHASFFPMRTLREPSPGIAGVPCVVLSRIRAAGFPITCTVPQLISTSGLFIVIDAGVISILDAPQVSLMLTSPIDSTLKASIL